MNSRNHSASLDAALAANRAELKRTIFGRWPYRVHPEILVADALELAFACPELTNRRLLAEMLEACMGALDAGPPAPSIGAENDGACPDSVGAEASNWAACATPRELIAYMRAIVGEGRSLNLVNRARKVLFVEMWGQLDPADRVEFLRRADPNGSIRARANG